MKQENKQNNKITKIFTNFFDDKYRITLLIILIGIFIRLLVMPFTAHPDFMNATWREHLLSLHNSYKVNDLNEVILAFYLKSTKFFFNSNFDRYLTLPDQAGDPLVSHFSAFISQGSTRYIFFLKIPYLIADLLSLYFLLKIVADDKKNWIVATVWAFNPLILYSVFIWGRYEVFPILFTTIALYLVKRERFLWSILFLGFAIAARMSFVLIIPFFIIFYAKKWQDVIWSVLIAISPWLLLNQINKLMSQETVMAGVERGHLINYITTGQMGSSQSEISFFLILYPIVVYLFYREGKARNFLKLVYYTTLALLVFYINARYNPQYFAWITPFIGLAIVFNKKLILPTISMLLSFFFFVDSVWSEPVSIGLFRPLNNEFFNSFLSYRHQLIFSMIDQTSFQVFFQSIFVLSAICIIYILYRGRNENIEN